TDDNGCTATAQVVVEDASPEIVFERGALIGVGNSWQTINLTNSYTSPVVIASVVIPDNSQAPVVTRVRNAGASSFEVKVQQPGGATADTYSVQYFVVEEGVYDQATYGITMEAIRANANLTAARGRWGNSYLEQRTYQNSYQNPVVLGQVMSENDQNWSVFWASANATRTGIPGASSFAAGKQVAEDPNRNRAAESIGYVVIESGSGTLGGLDFLAGVGSDIVRGQENSSLGYLYDAPNMLLLGGVISSAGMDGGDGGWAIFKADPIGSGGFRLAIEEDQLRDSERKHTTEQVAFLVFGYQNSSTPVTPNPTEPVVQSEDMLSIIPNGAISLFPNPAQDYLSVVAQVERDERIDVIITDVNGRALGRLQVQANANGDLRSQLDVRNYPRGIYLLYLVGEQTKQVQKFVVSR
ncbi:MAG: T9SS type A sorting domain-containing protein, partial [Bacteroidota bacterium]